MEHSTERLHGTTCLVAAMLMPAMVVAQDLYVVPNAAPISSWGSAYVMAGPSSVDGFELFMDDMKRLAPGSALLELDLSEHRRGVGDWIGGLPPVAWAANLGLHPFRNEARSGPELRIGVQYAGGEIGSLDFDLVREYPFDTLVSLTSGAVHYVDSVTWSQLSMKHQAERIGLDASVIFRSKESIRWTIYGGAGLGLGAVFNARTELDHVTGWEIRYPGNAWSDRREEVIEERYRNAGGGWFAAQAIFGVGFRLARRGDFLRRMDLFYEFRPQMLLTFGDDLGSTTRFGDQWLFGLRVRLHE